MAASGKVYLVGAGPGSPDLISVRGFRALVKADAIIFDSLLPASFLDELGIQGEGKELRHLRRRGARESQDEINGLMGEWASRGMTVVRLKGGDPGVFGCLNEEIAFLSGRGIPWEVVPGPSVCTAALSAAGLPLTLRGERRRRLQRNLSVGRYPGGLHGCRHVGLSRGPTHVARVGCSHSLSFHRTSLHCR